MAGAENSSSGKPVGARLALNARLPRVLAHWERLLAIVGLAAFLGGTMPSLDPKLDATLTLFCLGVSLLFGLQYAAGFLRASERVRWAASGHSLIDLLAAAPIPLLLAVGTP